MLTTAAAGPTALWYLTRGTGTVSLILLTLSVALGVMNVRRMRTAMVPRFVFDAVHRNASLLAMAFVVVHIVTSVLDGFAPISLLDSVIPFKSAYRPLWLGLGAVAFDLLIAVTVTSLVRRRLGYRAWRGVHWAAYASWPVALLHGLGTGSDVKVSWMLVVTGACLIVVIVAVVARATEGWPSHAGARLTALAASAIVPIGLLVWLPSGPLAAGWAKKADTPASLVGSTASATSSHAAASHASATSSHAGGPAGGSSPPTSFTAQVGGQMSQSQDASGLAKVDLALSVAGQQLSKLNIQILGQPAAGGGVQMTRSAVSLGAASNPSLYQGTVVALDGTNIEARLRDPSGNAVRLLARLQIDQNSQSVSGTVIAR